MTTEPDFRALAMRAGTVLRPQSPIDQRDFFAGRIEHLQRAGDAVMTPGQHVALFGERGVGKTSLATVLPSVATFLSKGPVIAVRENCAAADTYADLWHRAFAGVLIQIPTVGLGFGSASKTETINLASAVPEKPGVADVVTALRQMMLPLLFIFDEFDQIHDKQVAAMFAETIKALSDYSVPSTVVIVGIGDTVDQLIASHASVERALVQIRLPRMAPQELYEIIEKAMGTLGTTCDNQARRRIVQMSQGLPHYVHLIGLQATRHAFSRRSMALTIDDVDIGIKRALNDASQSTLDAYMKAVTTPQRDTLFKHVLLACALAECDSLGFFSAAAVRAALGAIGKSLEIPAFASHLNKFTSPERGEVLQKRGEARRYRFRFRNPLIQPYIVMRGVADGLVSSECVEKTLRSEPDAIIPDARRQRRGS